jgi:hypothetical protein
MLYFDNIQEEGFGSTRQQIWAFLHFPYHLALVLLMEGTNQFVVWRHVIELVTKYFSAIMAISDSSTLADLYTALNDTIYSAYESFPLSNDTFTEALESLELFSPESNATTEQQEDGYESILLGIFKAVFDGFGFEPPSEAEGESFDDIINSYYAVFELIFGYFFICAGIVVMGHGVLSALSMHRDGFDNHWRRYVGIAANLLLGLGLTLLSIMVLNEDNADNFGESVWTLPLLVFVLFIGELSCCDK